MKYSQWRAKYDDILSTRILRVNEDEYDIDTIQNYSPMIDFQFSLTPGEAAANAIDSGYLGDSGDLLMQHSGEWGGEYAPDSD
jgi:hypothetical protein